MEMLHSNLFCKAFEANKEIVNLFVVYNISIKL